MAIEARSRVDSRPTRPYKPPLDTPVAPVCAGVPPFWNTFDPDNPMKVRSSLKSLKTRHRDCKVVRRKGRVYVINKTDPRFKARQG